MNKLFGTDGIREIFYRYPLNLSGLVKLGMTLNTELGSSSTRVLLGGDTRSSTRNIIDILSSVMSYHGIEVTDLGVCPTPGIAYLTKKRGYSIGIVVSASHNPYQYNGIKFFSPNGMKLSDEVEQRLESIFFSEEFADPDMERVIPVPIIRNSDIMGDYTDYVKNIFRTEKLKKKVVIDTANGATITCSREVFKEIFEKVEFINNDPDGKNINENCGSTNIDTLIHAVKKADADWGIAFDGDGDRLMIVDREGFIFDGDYILSVLAMQMKKSGRLPNNAVTATVMSNFGMEKFLESVGIKIRRAPVGDRFVLEKMLEHGDLLGGEQSGHVILLEDSTTGDGLISAVKFFDVLSESPDIIRKVKEGLKKYPQVLINVKVKNGKKELVLNDTQVKLRIAAAEQRLGAGGRILLRPSGTEHLFRVMTEGIDQQLITSVANDVSGYIKENYGE